MMRDKEIRRAITLERVKSYLAEVLGVKDIDKWLSKNVFNLDLSELTPKQAKALHKTIKKELKGIYDGNIEKVKQALEDVFENAYEREAVEVKKYVSKPVEDKPPEIGALFSSPLSYKGVTGLTLDEVFDSLSEAESKRVADIVRLAHHQGKTTQEVVRMVRGTKASNYQDGVLSISKRNAEAIVRTSVGVVASEAKQVFIQQNKDLIKGIQVVATLDGRTSATCRGLDGQEMSLEDAIYPPYHFNCRSSFIYVLKENFVKPEFRASMNGKTENVTYYEWLKTQSPEFQDEVLGKARGKLFREGGLTVEQFKALQMDKRFKPMTLKEFAEKEVSVSEKAKALMDEFKTNGVEYRPVKMLKKTLSEEAIIHKIAGGDMTDGSCVSLALSYIGNKIGFDVTDYRGGESLEVFSRGINIEKILSLDGINSKIISVPVDFYGALKVLGNEVQEGKEYFFGAGKHVAIVRKVNDGYEFLELQSSKKNGWLPLRTRELSWRFGTSNRQKKFAGLKVNSRIFLAEVDSFKNAKTDFKAILGYLNTATDEQKKGVKGWEK